MPEESTGKKVAYLRAKSFSITRVTLSVVVMMILAGSVFALAIKPAFAASSSIVPIPAVSLKNTGIFQHLKLQFTVNAGTFIDKIRVTTDYGTGSPKVIEFEADGTVIIKDSAYKGVKGETTQMSNGYAIFTAKGKFLITLYKSALTVGTHYVYAEVLTDSGTVVSSTTFELRAAQSSKPDLKVNWFSSQYTIKKGKTVSTFTSIRNDGAGPAGPFNMKIYLSSDSVLSSGDTWVGGEDFITLGKGYNEVHNIKVTIPSSTSSGVKYLIVKVDADNVVNESNEGNNLKKRTVNIVS